MTIIEQIQCGYESAFTLIYNQYHKKLYFYFIKKSNSREISKELVQLTFIKLWQSRHALSNHYAFDSQLFNIARTTFIDYLRQQASNKNRILSYSESSDHYIEVLSSQYNSSFEVSDYLEQAIQSLSQARRNVYVLSRINGLSNKEIAKKLSISVKTVEDHMTKAIRQIKSISSF